MILIVKLKLIYLRISSIYLRVSSFSFAKYVTSHKKQEQKMTRKLQVNMHAYTVQLPSTFVSDFRGRTKFLLLERNNTGSSFLDSCFVRI